MTILGNPGIISSKKSGAFVPTDISGIQLWLKADAGITKDGSNNVTAWADQSGVGNDYSQANTSFSPVWTDAVIGSLPGLLFTQANSEHLDVDTTFNVAQPCTVFIVFDCIDYGNIFRKDATHVTYLAAAGAFNHNYGSLQIVGSSWDTDPLMTRILYNGSSSIQDNRLVSDSSFNPGTNDFEPDIIGRDSTATFGGYIFEIIVYDSSLSAGDITNVETYLKGRWGAGI